MGRRFGGDASCLLLRRTNGADADAAEAIRDYVIWEANDGRSAEWFKDMTPNAGETTK